MRGEHNQPTRQRHSAHGKLRELRRQNAQAVDQLRRANDDLHHFVRALSHDMSVNLILLKSSFDQLRRRFSASESPELDRDIALVDACLRQSRRFLDDMVELGRTGSVQVEPARVELEAVVEEVLFEQRDVLQSRAVEMTVEKPLPVLWCNQDRVKQIVVNLVRNAVKHGCDPQSPRITISAVGGPARTTAAGDLLAGFRVHDNGPGIPRRFHQEIFLPGKRLPGAHPDGSGMGLAIVRKIVDLYAGEVYVDPRCREGTRIVVWLPLGQLAAKDGAKSSVHSGHGLRTRPKIVTRSAV
jgi:two-component system, LuxR family, sensor kinase FixL